MRFRCKGPAVPNHRFQCMSGPPAGRIARAETPRLCRSAPPWSVEQTDASNGQAQRGSCKKKGPKCHQHTRDSARPFGHVTACSERTDCQKLSLQPLMGNAHAQYQRRPHFRGMSEHRVMCDECADRSNPKPPSPPRCLGCAQPMKFVRRTQRFGGLPDLYIFPAEDVANGIQSKATSVS